MEWSRPNPSIGAEGLGRPSRRYLFALALAGTVAACTSAPRTPPIDEGVRRLLTLATQRAFARLFAPNGFYDAQVARLPQLIGKRRGRLAEIVGAVMQTEAFRRRLAWTLNRIAQGAAERATPVVMQAIRGLPPGAALAAFNAGPTAATDLLKMRAGAAVMDVLLPGISRGLRSDLAEMAGAALSAGTGIDYVELGQTLGSQALDAMFVEIGREEAAIRADPAATRDPVLIALLAPGRRRR